MKLWFQNKDRQKLYEDLAFMGLSVGLLLPVRLFFTQAFSHYWIGSVGILSSTIFLVYYLGGRGKLGRFGFLIIGKLNRMAGGKWGVMLIIQSSWVIYFSSMVLMGHFWGDQTIADTFVNVMNNQGFDQLNATSIPKLATFDIHHASLPEIPASFLMMLIPNPFTLGIYKAMDMLTNGWFVSWSLVFLVEECEVLGIILFLRHHNSKLEVTS